MDARVRRYYLCICSRVAVVTRALGMCVCREVSIECARHARPVHQWRVRGAVTGLFVSGV